MEQATLHAVILGTGRGEPVRALTATKAKCMREVGGHSLILVLCQHGCDESPYRPPSSHCWQITEATALLDRAVRLGDPSPRPPGIYRIRATGIVRRDAGPAVPAAIKR